MKRFFSAMAMAALAALAVSPASAGFADTAGSRYQVKPDITYAVASGQELKLDLYLRRAPARGAPVLVYFHGGGWVDGHKENAAMLLLPYLEMGWTVVNVEYRLARVAPAPAAVEDVRCALRWVARSAAQYGFDSERIVVAGDSAGGHLALMSALVPAGSPFDRACATPDAVRWNSAQEPPVKVAAVVNWFGVTDVAAMLEGPEARHYAVEWFGSNPERGALAQRLSPLALVRRGAPPVITVHGGADPVVPYNQALRLHAALAAAGVTNRLVTIDGGKHGGFAEGDAQRANDAIRDFLHAQGLDAAP